MWHRLDIIFGIMLVNLFTASIVSIAADTQNSEAESLELLRDMAQVRTLGETKDLEGLEKEVVHHKQGTLWIYDVGNMWQL